MKTWLTVASIFLTGTATATESLQDCAIKSVRERVLAEQSGGPKRATEEGEVAPAASGPAVFEVVIACDRTRYFAVFTTGGKFNRTDFDKGRAIRVSIEDDKMAIENREGMRATGRLTAAR